MLPKCHVQIIRDASNLVLFIPNVFEIPSNGVIVKRGGGRLIIFPVKTKDLLGL